MAGLGVAEQSRSAAESQVGAWSPGENGRYSQCAYINIQFNSDIRCT